MGDNGMLACERHGNQGRRRHRQCRSAAAGTRCLAAGTRSHPLGHGVVRRDTESSAGTRSRPPGHGVVRRA
ncbi:hypothetical protein EBESD8_61560 [Rhodococcus aetherivorans]|nr:hypothetical protein EBESD8_61560 [Rhodococcus aetherivorans]